jgi:hypothetical protein
MMYGCWPVIAISQRLFLFQVRGQFTHAFLGGEIGDLVHLVEHAPYALGLFAAQVALADLGSHELARPSILESFGCSFVRLDFWH